MSTPKSAAPPEGGGGMTPQEALAHTHDLRIGASEWENGRVRAWQVYCVICDDAGRIVLPIEFDASLHPEVIEKANGYDSRSSLTEALAAADTP